MEREQQERITHIALVRRPPHLDEILSHQSFFRCPSASFVIVSIRVIIFLVTMNPLGHWYYLLFLIKETCDEYYGQWFLASNHQLSQERQ